MWDKSLVMKISGGRLHCFVIIWDFKSCIVMNSVVEQCKFSIFPCIM